MEPDLVGEHPVATAYRDQVQVLAGALTDRTPEALIPPLRLLARAAREHPTTWQPAAALTAAEESIDIYQQLARQLPEVFSNDLLGAQGRWPMFWRRWRGLHEADELTAASWTQSGKGD